VIDLTERKAIEHKLMHLSGRLITAQEEERKRLARELHDDLNQRIALMSIELEQLGQTASNLGGGFHARLQNLQRRAQEISTDIHRMSYELHPSKLDHLGLVPALRSFCRELSVSRRVHVDFTYSGFPVDLTPEKTLCIFRVAQETLQNAARHSGSPTISIHLAKTPESIELVVTDRGCGFDVNSREMTGGLGFTSIRERIRAVDGRMQISSNPGRGTRISVSIPIDENHATRT
jgi:signal transduction histidine kinase